MDASNDREELLGEAAKQAVKPTPGIVAEHHDDMIGRAHVAQKAFATDVKTRLASNGSPEERFAELQRLTRIYLSEADEALLERAFRFASEAHEGQCRKSGEPFIAHPVEVAIILSDLRMDVETLCAALLHDTVEDTDVTSELVAKRFSPQISQLVDGVTKITRIEVESLSDKQAATIRKMFVAMSKDIRVIVIKLADRLHNMRTLGALREDRRIFKSRETLEIYAPIAHRLGINSIKWELEDLAFFYLEPNKFKQISRMVTESRAEREEYLALVIGVLRGEMDKVSIDAQIMGRPKHLWSIYQKMTRKGKGFSEIYDLIAVRIIVKTVKDCYSALGAVHTLWHPMPGRFKDYIAMPKFNMYQSLHTTVIGPAGRPLEVQIRTEDMHHASEYGVAAHWRYKEKGASRDAAMDQQLAWLRQMIDWQDDTQDSREFLKDLKVDLAPSEVFVFTPKGEVMNLRAGSTPIDFAYAIHTEVGNHCVGAKVNGSIVPLSYELQLGDRVEILTQKSATPSRNWLNMVKTTSARHKIRAFFSKASRSDDLQEGHDRLVREMRKHGLGISNAQATRAVKGVADTLGYKDDEDMLVAIGTGRENPQAVANRLLKILVDRGSESGEEVRIANSAMSTGKMPPMLTSVKRPKRHETHADNGIVVRGVDDVLVRLSRCCNPVPGDEILGFVTRGRGVSVHRADCPNAVDLKRSPERIIEVSWENDLPRNTSYKVEVFLECLDRTNLLRDVVVVLSDMGANVLSSSTTSHRDSMVEMRFLFQVSDINSIEIVLDKLRRIEGVFDARRMVPGVSKKAK
ncbi:bifunctional (p)ppGpp synthetase/guanosine-3',5'-bis(diphosphate) 3'-pyrophosphohydrolase [Adlercreutzia sp. ZJ138]|uniref:RelA/SpoT family protein n=1 Tax=Adlercreutzia sp. ZJ138 TaxID=2709405 RepID=UPI0013ECF00D|nr:bifunctional (p)ppGpp synthetase/guanosine-3',5'-bis(diphosphate) 3'-pyrophosphohydrolase [Adlercreutzia sp. ZJ138]